MLITFPVPEPEPHTHAHIGMSEWERGLFCGLLEWERRAIGVQLTQMESTKHSQPSFGQTIVPTGTSHTQKGQSYGRAQIFLLSIFFPSHFPNPRKVF